MMSDYRKQINDHCAAFMSLWRKLYTNGESVAWEHKSLAYSVSIEASN